MHIHLDHIDRPASHVDLEADGDFFHLVATTPNGRFRHYRELDPEIAEPQRFQVQQSLDAGRPINRQYWQRIQPPAPTLPTGHRRVRGFLLYTPNISFTRIPEPELKMVRVQEPVHILELQTANGTYRSSMHWDERVSAEQALEDHLPLTDFTVAMDPDAWEHIDDAPGPLSIDVRTIQLNAYQIEYHTPCMRHRHPAIFESAEEAEAELPEIWLSMPSILDDWEHFPVERTSRPFAFLALVDDKRVRHDNLIVWDTHHIPGFTRLQKGDLVEVDLRPHAYQGCTQWTVIALRLLWSARERRLDDRPRRVGRLVWRHIVDG